MLGVGMGKQVGLSEGGIFIMYYIIYHYIFSSCIIQYTSLYIFILYYIINIIIYSLAWCIHIFDQTLMILFIAGGPLSLKD